LKRRNEAELCSLPENYSIYVIDVKDRFGPYGMLELVRKWGSRYLEAQPVEGPRNQPVNEFLKRRGLEIRGQDRFRFSTTSSCNIPQHIAWTGPLNAVASCHP